MSVRLGRPPAIDGEDLRTAVEMYRGGASLAVVALRFGVSSSAVNRAMVRVGQPLRGDDCRRHSLYQEFFDEIDSEDKAYWLGFLTADGNVYGTRIQVNLKSSDKKHLESFASTLGYDGAVRDTKTHSKQTGKTYVGATLSFRSKHMAGSLAKYGVVPRKSYTSTPWSGPSELMRHYWRGMVDGDGWVLLDNRSRLVVGLCGTERICAGFASFVAGQQVAHKTHKAGSIRAVSYTGEPAISVRNLLYKDAHIALERKVGVVGHGCS